MTVESATYISQLDATKPSGSDDISEGDNHIALIKAVLQAQFTSLGAAAVSVTAAQINDVINKALRAGDTYTGTHDFTGATLNVATQAAGDSSTKPASTAFVTATALSAVLPGINVASKGAAITNDGTNAAWGDPTLSAQAFFFMSM